MPSHDELRRQKERLDQGLLLLLLSLEAPAAEFHRASFRTWDLSKAYQKTLREAAPGAVNPEVREAWVREADVLDENLMFLLQSLVSYRRHKGFEGGEGDAAVPEKIGPAPPAGPAAQAKPVPQQ